MGIRTMFRIGFLGVAAVVGLLVYANWRTQAEVSASSTTPVAELAMPDDGRPVESLTSVLNVVKSSNGVDVYRVKASSRIAYEDGWSRHADGEVTLYGRRPDSSSDDTHMRSDRLMTAGASTDLSEVRMNGNVRATLPRGGVFQTNRITYDPITALVETCSRSVLQYAGIDVTADCLEFHAGGDVTSGAALVPEELRMWGDLKLRSSSEGGSMPAGLSGAAEEMRLVPGGELVRLFGEPSLNLSRAAVRGRQVTLDVTPEGDRLRAVHAEDAARMRYRIDGGELAEATRAGNADEESGTADEHVLRGRTIDLEFDGDGEISTVRVSANVAEPARLWLASFGRLDARSIELTPRQERVSVDARGAVDWRARGDAAVRTLVANVFRMTMEGDTPRALAARDNVQATIASGTETRQFSGPRLEMAWEDGELASAEWSEGVAFEADGRSLRSGKASLSAAGTAWSLTDSPTVSSNGLDLSGTTMTVDTDGGLEVVGDVAAQVSGQYLLAARALFGDVETVTIRADKAEAAPGGALTMSESVRIVWGRQSLVANTLRLASEPGRLHARGQVDLVAESGNSAPEPGDAVEDTAADRGLDEPELITVQANALLVEDGVDELNIAGEIITEAQIAAAVLAGIRPVGDAKLQFGSRRIWSRHMRVVLGDDGGWTKIVASGYARLEDRSAIATGETLEYDLGDGSLRIRSSDTLPASFEYEGLRYSGKEELRIRYTDTDVIVESTENGRTQTRRIPIEGSATS